MTTLQAKTWARYAHRDAKAGNDRPNGNFLRDALGYVLIIALLIAGISLRAYLFVPLK